MRFSLVLLALILCIACNKEEEAPKEELVVQELLPVIIEKFGYNLNEFKVLEDTIKHGDSFGELLYKNHVEYPEVYKIVEKVKDSFDVRRLRSGRPFTILAKKDSTEKAQIFIYQPRLTEFVVIDFRDSIFVKSIKKKIITRLRTATGKITDSLSSLSLVIDHQGLDYAIVNEMSDIYAWSIDFFHMQKEDNFKVIYEEKFIDDSIYVGIGKVKAAYFEHKNTPFYAFDYVTDSSKVISDFYDENAVNLRKQFLKAPIKFSSRISSRYNLKRFIRYYGRVKPHRGTDFAAGVGTPIISTANGRVVESRRRGGNGKYVKIKHNSVYSTQYLHMSRRKVNVGEYVKQGDVIGYVGMTGNTSGPHVCYRFWKNGVQVDPLKQKLPAAEPIKEALKADYLSFIAPLKVQLDQTSIE